MNEIDPDSDFAGEARFLSHFSNVSRLRIVLMLRSGEQSVGHLAGALHMSQGGASQHLSRMREAGIVASRRDAQNIYYRLISDDAYDLVTCAMECVAKEREHRTRPATERV